MKARELRKSSPDDLQKQLRELLKEQFNLRMHKATGQLSRPARVKAVRREIARIRTVMHELKAGGAQ
jgi:large subunit ribosomal protein L29